jgi:hypothetical protein
MRFRVFAAVLVTAACVPAAAGAFVTPELTVLSSPQPGVLHAEWVNPDDAVGFGYNAVRCVDLTALGSSAVPDMSRWTRWPGNYTTGSADQPVAAGDSYRCYVTEIDTAGRVGGRSVPLDVTAAAGPLSDAVSVTHPGADRHSDAYAIAGPDAHPDPAADRRDGPVGRRLRQPAGRRGRHARQPWRVRVDVQQHRA